jgi:hypothetical protein
MPVPVKPIRILAFLGAVLTLLLLLSLLFPPEGISLTSKFKLQFFKLNQVFQKPVYKDISAIIKKSDALKEDSIVQKDSSRTFLPDINSSALNPLIANRSKVQSFVPTISPGQIKYHFEYPNNDSTALFPFYEALVSMQQSKSLIRIMHYGDSQIEADHITSYIRHKLQTNFGGSGIGLTPIVYINKIGASMSISFSDNLKRYAINDPSAKGKQYGALCEYCRFVPEYERNSRLNRFAGWINIKGSVLPYNTAKYYRRIRLFYGLNNKPLHATLLKDSINFEANLFPPTQSIQTMEWKFKHAPEKITLKFNGEDSPSIFGIALDDTCGIAVDNIPMRGSKGLEFTRMNPVLLKEMYDKLDVKLLILEFGVNVVPEVKSNYYNYEKQYYNQLLTLKALTGNIPIIVMGLSDMSQNSNGTYVSFPNIEKIRDAQRNAAFKAGCVFWDTYQAMGGRNAMPSWVDTKPPLAQKDYIHFSATGARVIAEMFYNTLMEDYKRFTER